MSENNRKLGTDPYKGVRDFYPVDMAVQNKIFEIWRNNCMKYGYEEYNASVLEPADLYKAKSGDELVNEQTYTFKDRGDREVTLRPEMTPTLARMVANKKRELVYPVRWFSIPNLFRYEQPQRGRTREHWQLNADIFGIEANTADIEIINLAYDITCSYGLTDRDFEIRLNSRKIINYITDTLLGLNEIQAKKVCRLIDRKAKMEKESFELSIKEIIGDEERIRTLLTLLNSGNFNDFVSKLPKTKEELSGLSDIREIIAGLERLGITNTRFDPTLMRGFDYYTGTVFEIFDLNPANKRSVFGGGRYDDLLSLFGNERVPAVGFGAGDLVARDLMETYGTLPKTKEMADVAICIIGSQNIPYALDIAQKIRAEDIRVFVDLSDKKVGDQISNASKRGIPKVICIGDEEVKTGLLKVKNLETGKEEVGKEDELIKWL